MARGVVVKVVVDDDLATLTFRRGGCGGGGRETTIALPRDQTPAQRHTLLREKYPAATIVSRWGREHVEAMVKQAQEHARGADQFDQADQRS